MFCVPTVCQAQRCQRRGVTLFLQGSQWLCAGRAGPPSSSQGRQPKVGLKEAHHLMSWCASEARSPDSRHGEGAVRTGCVSWASRMSLGEREGQWWSQAQGTKECETARSICRPGVAGMRPAWGVSGQRQEVGFGGPEGPPRCLRIAVASHLLTCFCLHLPADEAGGVRPHRALSQGASVTVAGPGDQSPCQLRSDAPHGSSPTF